MPNRISRFMCVLLFVVCASIGATAQNVCDPDGCPTDIPTNAGLNGGIASTFNNEANITFYIDTNSYAPGTAMYAAIFAAASAWKAYQQGVGVGIVNIVPIAGLPVIPGPPGISAAPDPLNPIVIFTQNPVNINSGEGVPITPVVPALKNGDTAWGVDSATGYTAIAESTYDPTYVSNVNNGSISGPGVIGLPVHEIAQPFGFGMCTAIGGDCDLSVGNDNGNTLSSESYCDQLLMHAILAAIWAAHPLPPQALPTPTCVINGGMYIDCSSITTESTETSSGSGSGSGGGGGGGGGGSDTSVFLLYTITTTVDISDDGGSSGSITTQTTYYYSDGSIIVGNPSTENYSVNSCSLYGV